MVAATTGAVLSALISRAVGTPSAGQAFGEKVGRSVEWFDARPLQTVMLSRVLPGMPFNTTSYILGLTRIRMRDIAVGTVVGFAPRCFAYVALGGSLRDLSSPEAKVTLVISVVLLVLVAAVPRILNGYRGFSFPGKETEHG